ncbi:MAG: dihydropteroate synthase, partial [Fidelibacterota bacterium]
MLTALLDIKRTLIMGVLNVTPDSFSDGGDYFGLDKALGRAHDMVKEGADVIDVGGESSRPGSRPVSVDEEKRRVLPVLEKLVDELDVPLSVDTRRSQVAQMALDLGVRIVNDITALRDDLEMARVVARFDAHVVIMHMKGTPADMQHNPHYEDLMGELVDFFEDRVQVARRSGISDGNNILDPGIGFGKRVGDNFTILKNLGRI